LVEKKEKQTMFEGFVAAVLEERRLDREEGRAEEREKGRQKEMASARKLKAHGFSDEEIADVLQIAIGDIAGL
jgi:predicted transposase YdaD